MIVLVVEDSETCQLMAQQVLAELFPKADIRVVHSWMQAAGHLQEAALVVIDWLLPDEIDAAQCGALAMLSRTGTPHCIWTSSPEYVPDGVNCPVVEKSGPAKLRTALRELMPTADE